jgi:hypothetical protein
MGKALELLKEQIQKIDGLKKPPAFNPDYKIWNNTTVKIMEEASIDPTLITMFKRPIPLRATMGERDRLEYYLEILEAQKKSLEGIINEQQRFAGTGNAIVAKVRPLGTYQLHPEIARVSAKLLDDGHFPQAVEEAFKRTINEVKAHMSRKGESI